MMKVLIAGYYGFNNIGDDLILFKIIEDLKNIDSDCEIVVWSGNKERTESLYGVNAVNRFSVNETESAVKWADVVIIGGGGLVHEYFTLDIKELFKNFGYNVSSYAAVPLFAKFYKKPLFYWAHGVGPVFSEKAKQFCKWFYSLADYIVVRDKFSYSFLKRLGCDTGNLYLDTDPVIGLSLNKILKRSKIEVRKNSKLVGINLRPWFGYKKALKEIRTAFQSILKTNNVTVIPIPFDLDLDKKILIEFFNELKGDSSYETDLLNRVNSFFDVVSLMSQIDAFVGIRLHSIIVSRLLNKSTIAFVYDKKVEVFAESLRIPYLYIGNLNSSELSDMLNELINCPKDYEKIDIDYKTPEVFKNFIKNFVHDSKGTKSNKGCQISTITNDVSFYEALVQSLKDELNAVNEEKERLFSEKASLQAEIEKLTAEIEKLTAEIEKLTAEIEKLTKERNNFLNQLDQIYSSDFWKVATFYYKIRESIPFLKYPHRILRILRREGFSSLISKLNRRVYRILKNIKELWKKETLKKTRNHKVISREIQDKRLESDTSWAPGVKGLVSIVLPVYNQADMLEEAVESILRQTYKNFELILINDGSTDGVEKVLKKYVNHPRVIVLTQKNLKLPAALNNAFRYASGEYYTWTSADNILLPRQLEVLVSELERHPEWGMVYSDYQAIDNNGNPLNNPSFRPHNQDLSDPSIMRLPDEVTYDNFHFSGDNFIGPSFMYRRSVAWAIGEYAVDTFGGEDYDYWLRIHHLFKIGHCSEILYLYRVHENTLNAKAKELGLFENINRLLSRDRKRIDFLNQDIPVITYPSKTVLPETPAIVIFNKDIISKVELPRHILAILTLQPNETLPNKDVLDKADIIVVHDKKMFFCLEKDYPYKVFFLENGKIEELFLKVAKIRLFDKLTINQRKIPTPSVFITDQVNLALQVDSLDKGGLEEVVYNLACHLDKKKFKVFIFINNRKIGYIGNLLKEKGYPVIMIHGDRRKLEAEIVKNKIHIVNFHYSIFGTDIYQRSGIKSVYTVHNSYTWLDSAARQIRNEAFKQIDFFITVSEQVKQFFLNKFEVDYQKITTISNGFNPKNFEQTKEIERSEVGLKKDDFVFLNVASFHPPKFQNILISAMKILVKQYPNFKLICIGNILDKKYYNYVKKRILKEGLKDNIILKDFVSKKELGGYYKMADVFILPSLQEGWSNAIMEAMYFGLPLIISNIGSAQDIMKCGKFGYIIPNPYKRIEDITVSDILEIAYNNNPPNLLALIKSMEESYKTREWWQKQSNALNKAVIENFTVDIMCQKYEQVFLEQLFINAKKEKYIYTK